MNLLLRVKKYLIKILSRNSSTNKTILYRKKDNFNLPQLKNRQYIYVALIVVLFILITLVLVTFKVPMFNNKIKNKKSQTTEEDSKEYQLSIATDSVKGEKKWQSYLEDRIDKEQTLRDTQLKLLEDSLNNTADSIKSNQDSELEEIKVRLSFLLNELNRIKTENISIKNEIDMFMDNAKQENLGTDLIVDSVENTADILPPDSNYNYIPATAYVSGRLLGGIAVSTSVSSASAPIPVIIRLETRGNLPKEFAVDIKQCRILGSCYGDISSERAIIRAEEMVCENKKDKTITTTSVAGLIYGDDGMNGIRGVVVSMSDRHLRNAFTSGVLSGFANVAHGKNSFTLTSAGAVNTKKQGGFGISKEGLMSGVSTAAEKLADYHIKLAENISPVILIPGGTKVDVVFTKGVYIGSRDVKKRIKKARKLNAGRRDGSQ